MSGEVNGAAATAPTQKKENQDVPAPAASTANSNPPKLSGAEIKAKKQAEKAARRAQAVAAKAAVAATSGAPVQGAQTGGDNKGNKQSKPKADGQAPSGAPASARPTAQRRQSQSTGQRQPAPLNVTKDVGPTIPECFSHLSMAKRIPLSEADKDVHPVVLAVGQQMATFTLRDNIARLRATLLAFKKVIETYESPQGHVFSRHFVPHVLNPQIEYLTECRPMCFAMGNAIRLLKARVTKLDLEISDEDGAKELLEAVDTFIQERIVFAEYVIAANAAEMIVDGDIILTYGHQRLVRHAIQKARDEGKEFEVAILDDPFDQTGQELAKKLRSIGIKVTYYPHLGGLRVNVKRATKVMIGAEALFANGSVYGPAGTCDIGMAATDLGVPVVALCETINFDRDRISTESLTYNEIDPERSTEDAFRLLFDTTPDRYITAVVTEYETGSGNSPATAIQAILRKQEDSN